MENVKTRDGTQEPEQIVSTTDSLLDRLRDLEGEEFILQVEIGGATGE